ncbi:MAG TPA: G8 domain-containing protein [Methylibium sp.]|nr:G8 domain-containing protein [Methylibium sp.]
MLPTAGAVVVIPAGRTVVLDTNPPTLAGLRIEGTLEFARRDLALSAGFIDVTGALVAGTPTSPYTHRATITLNGLPVAVNDGVSRGLMVRGGRVELYGSAPQPVWTKLNEHAAAGSTALTLAQATNWRANDTVAIAPTDFYGQSATERRTVSAASGAQVTLGTGLTNARWGRLQYVTSQGMSLTPEAGYTPPVTPAPTVLDERAAVANLSRNIVIQAPDDAVWQTTGFGAHVMVTDLRSRVVIDGVEMRRMGQAGVMGRYPMHWHMLSYSSTGTFLGDATGNLIRNSAIWGSSNRCVVLHATNGVQVRDNICQDVKGHAFFLEDAVERRNVFEGNLALMTRAPNAAQRLQVHEGEIFQAGPSGFWLTNPDNTVRNNHAADAAGNGFWLAFPRRPLGLAAAVPMLPDRLVHGPFEYNTAHTARGPGVLLDWVPRDAAGNVTTNRYVATADGSEWNYTNHVRIKFRGITSFKNRDGAYRNRVHAPDYEEWVTADNVGPAMAGQGDEGNIARGLFVGTSLNNRTAYPGTLPPSAFATYHSTFAMRDNTVVNFPFVTGQMSGMMKTDDYYLRGIDKGPVRNPNNRMIGSHPGFRVLPPNMDGQPLNNRNWTLAGALWDPHGYWGPQGNYWVYDVPFLTSGATCQWVLPAGQNGRSCDGQYYGVQNFQTDFDPSRFNFVAPMDIARQDGNGAEIGRWTIGDGATSAGFNNMRHFAARTGARYSLSFPGRPIPRWVNLNVSNAYRSGDSFVMSVPFDGAANAAGYTVAGFEFIREQVRTWSASDSRQQHVRRFQPASSLAEVTASAGDRMWQDRANNRVWFKFQGGLPFPSASTLAPNSDNDLYRMYSVALYAQ